MNFSPVAYDQSVRGDNGVSIFIDLLSVIAVEGEQLVLKTWSGMDMTH